MAAKAAVKATGAWIRLAAFAYPRDAAADDTAARMRAARR
jgi:hypothetical protein